MSTSTLYLNRRTRLIAAVVVGATMYFALGKQGVRVKT